MPAPGRNRLLLFQSGAIAYLLRATFSTDIAAPLPGSLPVDVGGPLTVVQNDGQFSQSGGALVFPAQSTPVWGDLEVVNPALARAVGRALIADLRLTTFSNAALGWSTTATPGSPSADFRAGLDISTGSTILSRDTVGQIPIGAMVTATAYQVAIILRGTGAFILAKGGSFTNWTLLWVVAVDSTAALYPVFTNFSSIGTLDNLRVLDLGTSDARFSTDYGLALNRSTFTATNGTALTAIVPEAGGAWTQLASSVWSVTSNKAVPGSASTTVAVIACSTADVVAEVTLNFSTFASSAEGGVALRMADATNGWQIILSGGGGTLRIYEVVAGAYINRASVAIGGLATGTDYRFIVVAEGSTITAYVNNGNRVTYASATSNQTSPNHGIYSFNSGQKTFDDFIVWPRTVTLRSDL